MSFELNKRLCILFGFTNLILGLTVRSNFNLGIAILMFLWVAFLEYSGVE
jgi:hypothetical protein